MKRPIPQYVEEIIDGAVSRLKNLQIGNTVSFAFMTDIHNCTEYTERALYAIQKINKCVPISFTCMGGDYLCNNSRTTHDDAIKQHNELGKIIEEYGNNSKIMVVNGNHDNNAFGMAENVLEADEIYDILMSHHKKVFVTDPESPKSMYGYYDDEENKLRAIFLNVMDTGYTKENAIQYIHSGAFGNRQLNWVANTALKLPSPEWGVVVFGHFEPIPNPFVESELIFGGNAMWEILKAFKSGTAYCVSEKKGELFYDVSCDFTEQGESELIGYFCGHHHNDWVWKNAKIPLVSHLSAASDNFGIRICSDGTKHTKTRGSGEESAFSVITINRDTKRISCIRCGAGPDFGVNY